MSKTQKCFNLVDVVQGEKRVFRNKFKGIPPSTFITFPALIRKGYGRARGVFRREQTNLL